MASVTEWKVPAAAQPRAEDYGYDLERALSAVVGLHTIIPPMPSPPRRSAPSAPATAC